MSDRLLDQFLEKGLLDLRGNDEWYEHITSTSRSLSNFLRANPEQIVPFAYAALQPHVGDMNSAVEKTLELLKAQWKTYASVTIESPKVMLRAIMLDALLENAESDDAMKSALAMLLAGALPHLSVGREGQVWTKVIDDLLSAVEREAEAAWTVPSEINIPEFPKFRMPAVRASVQGLKTDDKALESAMYAAVGPHNRQSQKTSDNPNPYWSNQGSDWGWEFAPRAATAISKAISDAKGRNTVSVNASPIADAMSTGIVNYLEAVVGHLASTTHGVEMRARLLWWKEALLSPSARVSYRNIDSKAAPGLMAYDYQLMLPSIAPASVSAFLLETVRKLQSDDETASLVEWLQALTGLSHAKAFRETIREIDFADGYRPLVSLIALEEPTAKSIEHVTVFPPDLSLTPSQFSRLVFLELQAMKAVKEIERLESTDEDSDEKENA